jgi:hypothetical protein
MEGGVKFLNKSLRVVVCKFNKGLDLLTRKSNDVEYCRGRKKRGFFFFFLGVRGCWHGNRENEVKTR